MKADEPGVFSRSCRGCGAEIVDPPGMGRGQWRRYCTNECRVRTQDQMPGATIRSLLPGDTVPEGPPRRYMSAQGYVRLRWRVRSGFYVETYEHRVRDGIVVEDEHVHHINRETDDNRTENLQGLTAREHAEIHSDDRRAPWEAIAQMYEAGKTQPQIAKALGVDNGTVSRSLKRLNVPIRPTYLRYDPPTDAEVRAAYAQSSSAVDLARRLDIRISTARTAMRRLGLPSFPAGRPGAKRDAA